MIYTHWQLDCEEINIIIIITYILFILPCIVGLLEYCFLLCFVYISRNIYTERLENIWYAACLPLWSDRMVCYSPGLEGFTIEYLALWEEPGVLRLTRQKIWIQNILLRSAVKVEDTFKGEKGRRSHNNQFYGEIVCCQKHLYLLCCWLNARILQI